MHHIDVVQNQAFKGGTILPKKSPKRWSFGQFAKKTQTAIQLRIMSPFTFCSKIKLDGRNHTQIIPNVELFQSEYSN